MVDAHLHLQDEVFAAAEDGILRELRAIGLARLGVDGTEPSDWDAVAALAREHREVVPFFGVHPWKVKGLPGGWEERLSELLAAHRGAGVGEIGLDKWIRGHDIGLQRDVLLRQLRIARDRDRPVALHCLQAWGHLLECLEEAGIRGRFLLHSFGGPGEMVDELLERGALFSVSGYFFRPEKREKLATFERIPERRILLETDAPSMSLPDALATHPWPRAGGDEVNHPANILGVYRAYADWCGRGLGDVIREKREVFEEWVGPGESTP